MSLFPHASLVIGLVLALATAAMFNWSWIAQHTITSQMPPLLLRRPVSAVKLLFSNRRWVIAYAVGLLGWALYFLALRLAPLSLVQSVSAGGLGLLAILAQRASGEPLPRREWVGVAFAIVGLVLLSVSLADPSTHGKHGSWSVLIAWIVLAGVGAILFIGPLGRYLAPGAGWGIAAGLLYAAADVGTKAIVGGGLFVVLVAPVWVYHVIAFATLQMSFQRGRALATAGLSSFCTNALPIAGGVLVFHERVPGGTLGVLRILAFACVVVGAVAVARKDRVVETPAVVGEDPPLALADLERA